MRSRKVPLRSWKRILVGCLCIALALVLVALVLHRLFPTEPSPLQGHLEELVIREKELSQRQWKLQAAQIAIMEEQVTRGGRDPITLEEEKLQRGDRDPISAEEQSLRGGRDLLDPRRNLVEEVRRLEQERILKPRQPSRWMDLHAELERTRRELEEVREEQRATEKEIQRQAAAWRASWIYRLRKAIGW